MSKGVLSSTRPFFRPSSPRPLQEIEKKRHDDLTKLKSQLEQIKALKEAADQRAGAMEDRMQREIAAERAARDHEVKALRVKVGGAIVSFYGYAYNRCFFVDIHDRMCSVCIGMIVFRYRADTKYELKSVRRLEESNDVFLSLYSTPNIS